MTLSQTTLSSEIVPYEHAQWSAVINALMIVASKRRYNITLIIITTLCVFAHKVFVL